MSMIQKKVLADHHKKMIQDQYQQGQAYFDTYLSHKKGNDAYILEKKSDKKVHVRSIFSMLQSLYSIFYIDERKVSFVASEFEGESITKMYNKLAQYDYKHMNKANFDFMKAYYGFIFGIGATRLVSWDSEKNIPTLENISTLSLILDPNEMKYGTKREFIGIKKCIKARYLTEEKGYFDLPVYSKEEQEKEVDIYHHYTRIDDEVVLTTWLGKSCGKLIKIEYFPKNSGLWENFGVSLFIPWKIGNGQVADLIELGAEYQKMASKITNLMLIQAQKDVLGEDRIVNINKVDIEYLSKGSQGGRNIPAELEEGETLANVLFQLPKEQPSHKAPEGINLLENLKQQSTGLSPINQGMVSDASMTKAEVQTLQANSNMKFRMIMDFLLKSDEDFWLSWQGFYRANFNGKKNIVLNNKYKTEYFSITNKDIKTGEFVVGSVMIKSASEIKKENQSKLQKMLATMPNLVPYMEKENQILYMRRICELNDIPEDEVLIYLPESMDEMKAKADLEKLNAGKPASEPQPWENHRIFIHIFKQGIPNEQNAQAIAQRTMMMLEAQQQQMQAPQEQGNMKNMQNISQAQATSQLLNQGQGQNQILSNEAIQW